MSSENDTTFVWSDAYSVEFPVIDDQHKTLVQMTNELYRAHRQGTVVEADILRKTIRDALEYAQVHFFTEEKFMKKANYPELTAHKELHSQFVANITAAFKKFEAGELQLLELADFLRDWLTNHIAVVDKAYTPYLKNIQHS